MRVGPSVAAHHQPHQHAHVPQEKVRHEAPQEVPPAAETEAGTDAGNTETGAETTEQSVAHKARGLHDKLASGHFNDVAAMRLRLNHARALEDAGVELPPPPESSTHPGRGFEKALAAYQAASPPPVEEPEDPAAEAVESELDADADLTDILPLDPPEPGEPGAVVDQDVIVDILPADPDPDTVDEPEDPAPGDVVVEEFGGVDLADDPFSVEGAA